MRCGQFTEERIKNCEIGLCHVNLSERFAILLNSVKRESQAFARLWTAAGKQKYEHQCTILPFDQAIKQNDVRTIWASGIRKSQPWPPSGRWRFGATRVSE